MKLNILFPDIIRITYSNAKIAGMKKFSYIFDSFCTLVFKSSSIYDNGGRLFKVVWYLEKDKYIFLER